MKSLPPISDAEFEVMDTCRKWIGVGSKIPEKGATLKVVYCQDKPSKAKVVL